MLIKFSTLISLELLIVAIAGALVLTLLAAVVIVAVKSGHDSYGKRFGEALRKFLPYAVVVGTIAFSTGYLAANGRTPSVSELITATLALLGLLNIYVFGTETKFKDVVGYSAFVFSAMLLFGTQYGSFARELDKTQRLMALSNQELQVRSWRKTLDLPDDIPSWMVSTEGK
jgi:hypothetical protein